MISMILPSWNRIPDLLRSIENIEETTQGYEVEIVVVLHNDDVEGYKEIANHDVKVAVLPRGYPDRSPYQCWQFGYRMSVGEWAVQTMDDVLFDLGWLDAALSHPNKGFIALWEPHWCGSLPICYMVTREFVKKVFGGYFALTYYHSGRADNEMKIRTQKIGAYTVCREASFVHLNRGHNDIPHDEYSRIAGSWSTRDLDIFNSRKLKGFPIKYAEAHNA